VIELDWVIDRIEGVTLVSATVATTATTPQRVRIESRLDGPSGIQVADRIQTLSGPTQAGTGSWNRTSTAVSASRVPQRPLSHRSK